MPAPQLPLLAWLLLWQAPHNAGARQVLGDVNLYRTLIAVAASIAVAACSAHPKSDQELAGAAQQAVNKRLGAQGVFSLMESVASQDIACGHVSAPDAPGRGAVDQDFVYQGRRLIMDDDPDFDRAAIECDVAAGGGNASDASNISDN